MTPEQGAGVAARMNARYMECSSREMKGVDEVFETAIDTAIVEEMAVKQQSQESMGYGGGRKKKRSCKIF